MTLEPGDIISTGTPEGVGAAMKPYPKFLNEGDIVQTAIAELGMMKNKIITDWKILVEFKKNTSDNREEIYKKFSKII